MLQLKIFEQPVFWLLILLYAFFFKAYVPKKHQYVFNFGFFNILGYLMADAFWLLMPALAVLFFIFLKFAWLKKIHVIFFYIFIILSKVILFYSEALKLPSFILLTSFTTFLFINLFSYVQSYKNAAAENVLNEYMHFFNSIFNPIQNISGPVRQQFLATKEFSTHHLLIFFLTGFFYKFFIHDHMAQFLTDKFSQPQYSSSLETLTAFFTAKIYIYTNIFGYTTMVYAILNMLSMPVSISFRKPFNARNILDFWTRWQIPLLKWLGENMQPALFSLIRPWGGLTALLTIQFLMISLWHGLTINFIIYGLLQVIFILIYRKWKNKLTKIRFLSNLHVSHFLFYTICLSLPALFFLTKNPFDVFNFFKSLGTSNISHYPSLFKHIFITVLFFYIETKSYRFYKFILGLDEKKLFILFGFAVLMIFIFGGATGGSFVYSNL